MPEHATLESLDSDRSYLIQALQLEQGTGGFISDEAIRRIAAHFSVPPVEVEGIVSFYAQFKRVKPGAYVIYLCDGTACHIKGATLVLGWVTEELGIAPGQTDAEGLFSLETVACLGCCSLAPVMSINGTAYGNLDRKSAIRILKRYRKEETADD
jgi:NADH:ubiquinone oxidoreductase subunit E